MPERVVEFIRSLRQAGVPVSIAEALDGMQAVMMHPDPSRSALKDALVTTLVKSHWDLPIFDKVFELFYEDNVPALNLPEPQWSSWKTEVQDAVDHSDTRTITELADALGAYFDLPGGGANNFSEGWGAAQNFLQRMETEFGFKNMENKLIEGFPEMGFPPLQEALRQREIKRFLQTFRERTGLQVRRKAGKYFSSKDLTRVRKEYRLDEVNFMAATYTQYLAMQRLIPALARRMAYRKSKRRRKISQGRLDFRRTLRKSLATGGVAFETYYKDRSRSKPELLLLCDVSGSVRLFSGLALLLAYCLKEQFQGVRSFAFINTVDEVTGYFNRFEYREALDCIQKESQVAVGDGHSDYGQVFKDFTERHLEIIKPKTVVLILGDGRANGHPAETWALEMMATRAKRLYWLVPERRESWNLGDSILRQYAPLCHRVVPCTNLNELADFVGALPQKA
ncbi:MAG: vWA domain-containing protein [Bacillota bacterium]